MLYFMKIIYLYSLLMVGGLLGVSCNQNKTITLTEQNSSFICTTLGADSCSEQKKQLPTVSLVNDTTVKVVTFIDCNHSLVAETVTEKNGVIKIRLLEEGRLKAGCGSNVQQITITVDRTINLNSLEVYVARESGRKWYQAATVERIY